jgi:hypothetical protein
LEKVIACRRIVIVVVIVVFEEDASLISLLWRIVYQQDLSVSLRSRNNTAR